MTLKWRMTLGKGKGQCTVCNREATVLRYMSFGDYNPLGIKGAKVYTCDKHADRYEPVPDWAE
jgi:hypothetical protein